MNKKDHRYWMHKAIAQAKMDGNPFGAVIVNEDDQCIEAFNTTKADGPTAHAEMNVIQKLKQLQYSKSQDLTLYSTVEPCPMCMSAIVWTGIGQLIFGASIADATKFGSQIQIPSKEVAERSWRNIQITSGVERDKCVALFKN